jgi:hypothetical protein
MQKVTWHYRMSSDFRATLYISTDSERQFRANSDFRHDLNLRSSGMLRCVVWQLPTFRDNLSVPSTTGQTVFLHCFTLEYGCPETSGKITNDIFIQVLLGSAFHCPACLFIARREHKQMGDTVSRLQNCLLLGVPVFWNITLRDCGSRRFGAKTSGNTYLPAKKKYIIALGLAPKNAVSK